MLNGIYATCQKENENFFVALTLRLEYFILQEEVSEAILNGRGIDLHLPWKVFRFSLRPYLIYTHLHLWFSNYWYYYLEKGILLFYKTSKTQLILSNETNVECHIRNHTKSNIGKLITIDVHLSYYKKDEFIYVLWSSFIKRLRMAYRRQNENYWIAFQ